MALKNRPNQAAQPEAPKVEPVAKPTQNEQPEASKVEPVAKPIQYEKLLQDKMSRILAHNSSLEKEAKEVAVAEVKKAVAELKKSGVTLVDGSTVTAGRYRSSKYKQHDPYTNITFSPDRPVFVAGVTPWFEMQVLAGVLIKVSEAE